LLLPAWAMSEAISLSIPLSPGLSTEGLKEALSRDKRLARFLTEGLSSVDLRATYTPDSFRIISVQKLPGSHEYSLHYQYDWDAYYGCSDMNSNGTEDDRVIFAYVSGVATFRRCHREQRDPDEL
jgi:hypothetical protein